AGAKSGESREIPVGEVEAGDRLVVRPGEKIPLDGVVIKGRSAVNQSPITGESLPVTKEPGDEVFAGTINGDGVLEMEVTRAVGDTTLARIVHMVQEAHSRRAPSEQWVEKFARHYTPVMILLALGIIVLPPLLFGGSWADWFYRGLVILIIGCPCALVISTPVSVVSGLARAARNGVLIKGGVYLESAGELKAIALDKTGTLTVGRPGVLDILPLNGHSRDEVLERAAALEAHSEHALAGAIRGQASAEGITVTPAVDLQVIKGKGAEGNIGGRDFWIGSHRLMEEKGAETEEIHQLAEELEGSGNSVVAVGNQEHVCGLITLADSPRDEARETIASLRKTGVERVVMLTGDNTGTARAMAEKTGVDGYLAELMPEDKVKAVEDLVRNTGRTAMVGDGVNDAPAMAAADIGIAMGAAGTDLAIETADIALMSDDLAKLPWLVRHSRRTLRTVKQNIGFALGLKLAFVLLTILGAASLWMAIAADTGASLLVTFNGLRLLGGGKKAT
ncbi:heavy metal translocating P-type ATPase, partial [candidate division KSB1 bacterium]